MIVELAAIAGVTIFGITVTSLRFTRWALNRQDRLDGNAPKRKPIAEQRKLLVDLRNKANATWLSSHGRIAEKAYNRLSKIEDDLAELDDEEIRIAKGEE